MGESAPAAYEDVWVQLSRRFGCTDAPGDAMRRFDSRRQRDGESLQEFGQALRLLHREAWPAKTQEQRDAELKRRFEDGLSNHVWRNTFAYTLVIATLQPQCSKPASLRMLQSQHDQRKA